MLSGNLGAVAALQKLLDLEVDVDLTLVEEALHNGATHVSEFAVLLEKT